MVASTNPIHEQEGRYLGREQRQNDKTMTDRTLIADLTVAELQELIRTTVREASQQPRRLVRGIQGIADTLQISYAQAKRVKAEGIIDKAITQSGRIILTDADYALRLYKGRQGRTHFNNS